MNARTATTRRSKYGGVAAAALLAAILAGPVLAGSLDRQVSRDDGVEVSVTPGALAPDTDVWEFEVAFNTHSVDLAGDPAASSVLVGAQGERHPALGWEGAAPGGHHRSGVLRFRPLDPSPEVIELHVGGVGGIATRTFRWER